MLQIVWSLFFFFFLYTDVTFAFLRTLGNVLVTKQKVAIREIGLLRDSGKSFNSWIGILG